jgi:phosphoribosylanthranilate isomerase
MARTRIKICGVMRPEDAALAARAGADAIGVVLFPEARRFVSVEKARQIVRAVPAFVSTVGMFVDQGVEEVRELARAVEVSAVQLHGHETPEEVAALREFPVLKALKAARETLGAELELWREAIEALDLGNLKGFVLETPTVGSVPGGTGAENDWEGIEAFVRAGKFEGLPAVIVAGGLRVDNVAEVVKRLRPWAVDVSSGVEAALGEKSAEKVSGFVAEVRKAEMA